MTLSIAINLNDYIVLTGDTRLTMEYDAPDTNYNFKMTFDNYKKIRLWDFGAIVTSGDVNLMDLFYENLQLESNNIFQTNDIIKIANTALYAYLLLGKPIDRALGWAYFSLFSNGNTVLLALSINANSINCETIPQLHANFSLFAGVPNDPIYQHFVNALREEKHFNSKNDFLNYHIDLIKYFYARQKSFDESISNDFDICFQDTSTGDFIFKHVPD